MANLITHSLSYTKEQTEEYFVTPLFVDNDIRNIVTLRTDVKSGDAMDFFSNLKKITKAWAKGSSFTSSTGVTITQKILTVASMKAEVKQNGHAFLNQVKQSLLKKGVDENDISDTLFDQIIMEIFTPALAADLNRQAFFGDTGKKTLSSGAPTTTDDVDYKEYDGIWTRIIEDFRLGTIPSGQRIDLNSTTYLDVAGVAEVITITLTGTSGTANIEINGTEYLATFDTDLTTTAANFVTTHATNVAAAFGNAVVTSSTADVIITSGIPGFNTTGTIANVSGNLAGTPAATTANVAATTLKAGAAQAIFQAQYEAMPAVMKSQKMQLRYIVTSSVMDNYRATIESATAGSEAAYRALLDGVETVGYRGIPVVERMDWDEHIEEDFGSVRAHRSLLTMPANLVVGMDGENDAMNVEFFFDKVEQDNVYRAEYKCGTQYIHEEYVVAAY